MKISTEGNIHVPESFSSTAPSYTIHLHSRPGRIHDGPLHELGDLDNFPFKSSGKRLLLPYAFKVNLLSCLVGKERKCIGDDVGTIATILLFLNKLFRLTEKESSLQSDYDNTSRQGQNSDVPSDAA